MITKPKIYIGYDSREKIASCVCKYSIKKRASINVCIKYLNRKKLINKKKFKRKEDRLSSTEFTFTRFLVPYLENYKGWSIFCDCDFLFIDDIKKIFKLADPKYAVMCVKHKYKPKNKMKMDGKKQLIYPRKNWSSLILWNCGHPENKKLTKKLVNTESGKYLHRFGWLKNKYIGEISKEWNWLVGLYKSPRDGNPKALHFTEGGPWFDNYKNTEYSSKWLLEREKYFKK